MGTGRSGEHSQIVLELEAERVQRAVVEAELDAERVQRAALEAELAGERGRSHALQRRATELQDRVAELERAYRVLLASRSWRLTEPLRALCRLLAFDRPAEVAASLPPRARTQPSWLEGGAAVADDRAVREGVTVIPDRP